MDVVINDSRIDNAQEETVKQFRFRDLLLGGLKALFATDEIDDSMEILEKENPELIKPLKAEEMKMGKDEPEQEETKTSFRDRQRLGTASGGGNSNRAGHGEIQPSIAEENIKENKEIGDES